MFIIMNLEKFLFKKMWNKEFFVLKKKREREGLLLDFY